jgi:4-diphosphocytidyl-2-C-methyl-D-erythritol kinase
VTLSTPAPAKINLSLAITGRRADGFHELLSVVAPVDLADRLTFAPGAEADILVCDDPTVPADGSNLVRRAAAAYRRRVPAAPWGRWHLEKRIPHGAGLGGGSSDAAAALRLLNQACGQPLGPSAMAEVASEVGSDCPLFLDPRPCVLRGRGDRVEVLSDAVAGSLRGRRVILAKPTWGVSTPDAYRWKAERGDYQSAAEAEAGLAAALGCPDPAAALVALGNALASVVVARHPAFSAGLDAACRQLGLSGAMTGSGSACFLLARGGEDLESVRSLLAESWGRDVWVASATLL